MAEKLKNQFLTIPFVHQLANSISEELQLTAPEIVQQFDLEKWENLELKERIYYAGEIIRGMLPEAFEEAIPILHVMAKKITGLEGTIFPGIIERYGQEHFNQSMDMLGEITRYSSSEFAVRPFILSDPVKSMAYFYKWSEDENEHTRRLASEGCRPRLPWSSKLPCFIDDPQPVLKALKPLVQDPSVYVQKSVANNLNDISKDHPEQVIQWLRTLDLHHPVTYWIGKHGLRTLIKNGHIEAMKLLGLIQGNLDFKTFEINKPEIEIGESLEFEFTVINSGKKEAKGVVDYAISFVKSNNKLSRKVFKIADLCLAPGASRKIVKNRPFVPLSTRRYYKGMHTIDIVINGQVMETKQFLLKV